MQANVKRSAARMRQAGIERPSRPRGRLLGGLFDFAADITRTAVILLILALFVLGVIVVT